LQQDLVNGISQETIKCEDSETGDVVEKWLEGFEVKQ
jgi:hypothetical protein